MAVFILMGNRFKRAVLPIPSSDHLSWHGINANSAWEAHQLDLSRLFVPRSLYMSWILPISGHFVCLELQYIANPDRLF